MDSFKFEIADDISIAETLPAEFYRSETAFQLSKDKIFSKSWQYVCDTDYIRTPGQIFPFTLLEGFLDEPLLLTRANDDKIHCLSNVCTHRGNILAESADNVKSIKCRYHGRRFGLDGCFKSMPEFDDTKNFPRPEDDLAKVPFSLWDRFIFASLNPSATMDAFFGDMIKRMEGVNITGYVHEPTRSRDYLVKANWALYTENYLEGFHIPYVHSALNEVIDYGTYTSELYRYSNLQLAFSKRGEECFELKESCADYGNEVAAYYWWVFPNMMFNFYPWGLSINIIRPIAKDMTKVSFITYVNNPDKLDRGAGSGLDRVEREDEAIVEQVQKGMNSRFYSTGRYSPKREAGVHHFHRLIAEFMSK